MAVSRSSSPAPSLLLAFFALPFAAVGVVMAGWIWWDVMRSREILAEWRPVPAVIERVELESRRGSKGGRTYKVTGTYRYLYHGRSFTSRQITLSDGADNIGRFHQNLHRQMRRARNAGDPMTVYVNPAMPSEAVLWPWWRLEMGLFKAFFGLVFGGVGAALVAAAVLAGRGRRERARLRVAHPAEPWRWRSDWAAGFSRPDFAAKAAAAWIGLAVLHAPTLPLWTGWPQAWAKAGWTLVLFALVLVVVGGGTLLALRTLIRVRRHRDWRVVLADVPLRPGGPARLGLVSAVALARDFVLTIELKCVRRRTVGVGKKRRVEEVILWSAKEEPPGPFYAGQVIVWAPELPPDQPGADPDPSDDCVLWRLDVSGRGPGPDLVAAFDLPVFAAAGDVNGGSGQKAA